MKAKYLNQKNVQTIILSISLVGLLLYLIALNFQLPFLTVDELSSILSTRHERVTSILSSGRYSQLLSIPIVEVLSFYNPNKYGLFPRFASMLLLFAALISLARRLSFSLYASTLLAAFIPMAHEVDWQHNGFVAFFGSYNVFLAFFIFAMILDERVSRNILISVLIFIFLMFSYSSELFIGLSLIYLVLQRIISGKGEGFARSPFFWSIVFYVAGFLLLRLVSNHESTAGMAGYLYGAVGTAGIADIVKGALLYFINSLPFYHKLSLSAPVSVILASIILIIASVALFISLFRLSRSSEVDGSDNAVAEKRKILLSCIIFIFAVSPNILIAIQPMKLNWILSGASARYAFSFYTWIGFAILVAYFVKRSMSAKNARIANALSMLMIIFSIGLVCYSAGRNIKFAKKYRDSRKSWQQLNKLLSQNKSKEVVVSPAYLKHPYITAVSAEYLKAYAKRFYGVQLRVCLNNSEIKLSDGGLEKFIRFDGFSVVEPGGRWTVGSVASLKFVDDIRKINFIELEITQIFADNLNVPLVVTNGGKVNEFILSGAGTHRFKLANEINGQLQLQFLIPKPTSPLAIGISADDRELGVMLRSIKLGFKNSTGQEDISIMEFCQ